MYIATFRKVTKDGKTDVCQNKGEQTPICLHQHMAN